MPDRRGGAEKRRLSERIDVRADGPACQLAVEVVTYRLHRDEGVTGRVGGNARARLDAEDRVRIAGGDRGDVRDAGGGLRRILLPAAQDAELAVNVQPEGANGSIAYQHHRVKRAGGDRGNIGQRADQHGRGLRQGIAEAQLPFQVAAPAVHLAACRHGEHVQATDRDPDDRRRQRHQGGGSRRASRGALPELPGAVISPRVDVAGHVDDGGVAALGRDLDAALDAREQKGRDRRSADRSVAEFSEWVVAEAPDLALVGEHIRRAAARRDLTRVAQVARVGGGRRWIGVDGRVAAEPGPLVTPRHDAAVVERGDHVRAPECDRSRVARNADLGQRRGVRRDHALLAKCVVPADGDRRQHRRE